MKLLSEYYIILLSFIIIIVLSIRYEKRIRLLRFESFKYKTRVKLYVDTCIKHRIPLIKENEIDFIIRNNKFYAFKKK